MRIEIDSIIETDKSTLINDVKQLFAALENGQPVEQFKSEIIRLYHVIVDCHMQDVIIEELGEKCLHKRV